MNLKATIFISKKVINYPNIRKHISTSVVPDLQRCSFLPTRPISGRAKPPCRYLLALFTGCCLVIIDVVAAFAAWDLFLAHL